MRCDEDDNEATLTQGCVFDTKESRAVSDDTSTRKHTHTRTNLHTRSHKHWHSTTRADTAVVPVCDDTHV